MDYRRIYNELIARARSRILDGYVERHHVIPKCMGGTDEITNLVQLTPEEHFLAHVLLVKIHPEEKNLILAVQKMTRARKGRPARKMYGWLKRKFAARMRELQTGKGNSQYGTRWINDGNGTAKKHKGELPEGWFEGRGSSLPATLNCKVCGVATRSRTSAYCDNHRTDPRDGRLSRRKVSDSQLLEAYAKYGNKAQAMRHCGLSVGSYKRINALVENGISG